MLNGYKCGKKMSSKLKMQLQQKAEYKGTHTVNSGSEMVEAKHDSGKEYILVYFDS